MKSGHMYIIFVRRLMGEYDSYAPYAYLLYMRPTNFKYIIIGEESEVVSRSISQGLLTLTFKTEQWTRITIYQVT